MNVLVTLYPEDAQGNRFFDCRDCAMSRAVKRILKPEYDVLEGGTQLYITSNDVHKDIPRCQVYHKGFDIGTFEKLRDLSKGSFMVYEMYIPKQYLKDGITKKDQKDKVKIKAFIK